MLSQANGRRVFCDAEAFQRGRKAQGVPAPGKIEDRGLAALLADRNVTIHRAFPAEMVRRRDHLAVTVRTSSPDDGAFHALPRKGRVLLPC